MPKYKDKRFSRIHRLLANLRGIAFGVYHRSTIYPPRKEVPVNQWERPFGRLKRKGICKIRVDAPQQQTFPSRTFLAPGSFLLEQTFLKEEVSFPESFVYTIPRARTIGAQGTVITDDNVILPELCSGWRRNPHPLLIAPQAMPRRLKRKKGIYALIATPCNSTFHWIFEILPRIELLRKAGYDLNDFDGFVMRKPKYPAHMETLELIGIPMSKVVWCTMTSHLGFDLMVVPSLPFAEHLHHIPWVIPFLKQLPARHLPTTGEASPRRRIVISRKDASVRRIVNQDALTTLLAEFGFEEVTLGDLSFIEQAKLFASADFIVSPHGGGLSNICFCEPSTKLIELFSPNSTLYFYHSIARQVGMDYEPLLTECVPFIEGLQHETDMRVDLQQLRTMVETMLAR